MNNYTLILASTSPYRSQLLSKLELDFITLAPECDETPYPSETPQALVMRLAQQKAQSCDLSSFKTLTPNSPLLVIGSDQVCVINNNIIGKPNTAKQAVEQLLQQSGQSITFYTGLALFNAYTQQCQVAIDHYTVHFRTITRAMAESYVAKEQPLNCAGSFKSEGLGIALFHALEGKDPNSLIGLPLITLIDMLANEGVSILA